MNADFPEANPVPRGLVRRLSERRCSGVGIMHWRWHLHKSLHITEIVSQRTSLPCQRSSDPSWIPTYAHTVACSVDHQARQHVAVVCCSQRKKLSRMQ